MIGALPPQSMCFKPLRPFCLLHLHRGDRTHSLLPSAFHSLPFLAPGQYPPDTMEVTQEGIISRVVLWPSRERLHRQVREAYRVTTETLCLLGARMSIALCRDSFSGLLYSKEKQSWLEKSPPPTLSRGTPVRTPRSGLFCQPPFCSIWPWLRG